MRALNWLKGLLKCESGNTLVIGAATMPLLLGSAAFAVDTIQLSVWKRQLQRAADSSAIAGAYALSQSQDEHDAVHNDLDKNKFPTLTQEETITVGARLGFNRTVRVQLTASRELPFLSIFTGGPSQILADATAALVDDGTFCMISLYDGEETGIDANGGGDVMLGCGMKANCDGDDCVTAGGNSSITASPIAAVGGIKGASQNFVQPTTLQPYSAPQTDPLSWVPNPDVDPAQCTGTLTEATTFSTTGVHCFASGNIGSNTSLSIPAGNTVVIYGGDLTIHGTLQATKSTIVLTGANGAAGDLKINAQANLNLTAPDDGDYKGIAIYRDRRASNIEIKINGGATSMIEGALYFPSSDITFTGNETMDVKCLQMVGQKLKFLGSATITNECRTDGGSSAFGQVVIRLID